MTPPAPRRTPPSSPKHCRDTRGSAQTAVTTVSSSATPVSLDDGHSLLLSHQSDELLSFLVDVLSDSHPTSSDAGSTENTAAHCGVTSFAVLLTTADKSAPQDTSSPPPKTTTLAAKARNKYRDQVKKELEKQRALVADLEAEVLAFQQGKIAMSADDRAKLSSAWQRIAKSQLAYRRQAEAENTYLKHELQRMIYIAQSINQILGSNGGLSYALGRQVTQRRRVSSQLHDADGFAELAMEIESSFSRVDAVFQESGIDQITSELSKSGRIKADKNDGGRQYIELTSVSIEPFNSRMASDKLWLALVALMSLHSGPRTELIWKTEDAFAVRYHPEDHNEQKLPRSKLAMKKFTTRSGKVVVVWRACSQLSGSLLGTMADETGWVAVQPIADSSGFQSSGSVVRTCVHFVQKSSPAVATRDSELNPQPSLEAFGDVILRLSDHDRKTVLRLLENMLLDDTIAPAG